jgi:hypothetical protein
MNSPADASGFDRRDFNFGQTLAMTHRAVVSFAALEFEGNDFVAAKLINDFGLHGCSLDERSSDTNRFSGTREKDLGECGGLAGFDIEFLDFQDIPFLNPVLLPTGFDNCVRHNE